MCAFIQNETQRESVLARVLQFLPLCELARLTRLSKEHRNFIIHQFQPLQITIRIGELDWWTFLSLSWGWIWLERVIRHAVEIRFRGDTGFLYRFFEILELSEPTQLQHLEVGLPFGRCCFPNHWKAMNWKWDNLQVLRIESVDYWNLRHFLWLPAYKVRNWNEASPHARMKPEIGSSGFDALSHWNREKFGEKDTFDAYAKTYDHRLWCSREDWGSALEEVRDITRKTITVPSLLTPLEWERGLGSLGLKDNHADGAEAERLFEIHSEWLRVRSATGRETTTWLERYLRAEFYKQFDYGRRRLADLLNETIPQEVRASRANLRVALCYKENPERLSRRLSLEDFKFLSEWIDYPPLFYRSTRFLSGESQWRLDEALEQNEKELEWSGLNWGYGEDIRGGPVSGPGWKAFAVARHFRRDMHLTENFLTESIQVVKIEVVLDYSEFLNADFTDTVAQLGIHWAIFTGDLTLAAIKFGYRAGLVAQRVHGHQIRFLPQTLGYYGPLGCQALLGMIKGEYNEDLWLSMDLRSAGTEWWIPRECGCHTEEIFVPRIKHLPPVTREYAIKWAAEMLDNVPIEITSEIRNLKVPRPTMSFEDAWRCIEGGHWLRLQEFGFFFEDIPAYRPF